MDGERVPENATPSVPIIRDMNTDIQIQRTF
jgi:hypothetical protein